jgi:hypothetical protein
MTVAATLYLLKEATAISLVKSLAWLLVAARMMFSSLSLPSQMPRDGLGEGDGVIVPLDGGHGDPPAQVLGVVAGGGEDECD